VLPGHRAQRNHLGHDLTLNKASTSRRHRISDRSRIRGQL
jgi:hypothetical protein